MAKVEDIFQALTDIKEEIENVKAELNSNLNQLKQDLQTAILGNTTNIANVLTNVQTNKSKLDTIGSAVSLLTKNSDNGGGGKGTPPPPPPSMNIDATAGFPIPKYDPACMTIESFLNEAVDYLTLKGVPQTHWHIIVGRMFDINSDIAHWYRANRSSYSDWDTFVLQIKSYEDNDANKDTLMEKLFARKQKLSDPFESFAWEIHASYRRIDPNVGDEAIVKRILSACLPELSQLLRSHTCSKVEDLIKTAKSVMHDLNMLRKLENKPLLRLRQTDPISTITHQNKSNGWKSQSGDKHQSSNQSQQQRPKCAYAACGKVGHKIEECRKKKYDDLLSNMIQPTTTSPSSGNAKKQ